MCNFEPVEIIFKGEGEIIPINPFKISISNGKIIEIIAFHDLEWLSFEDVTDRSVFPLIIRKNTVGSFSIKNRTSQKRGSFRLLGDSSNEIYEHEWR